MSILIKGMKMPKDCPMCPMAHYDLGVHFRGCDIVSGKKHAMNDQEYADSDCRPDWCPLIEIQQHGDLVDREELMKLQVIPSDNWVFRAIRTAPTIIPAEDGE